MAEDLNKMEEQEEMTVTLTLEDDSELECIVLTIFQAGDKDYIALLPMESQDTEEGEVFLYRYSETEDGTPIWKILKTMTSMRWLQTPLTNYWMKKNTMRS